MATQFHIAGPTTVYYGTAANAEDALGQSDGQTLITIREIVNDTPVTTDEAGGLPVDYIQRPVRARVEVALIKWDTDVLTKVKGRLTGAGTVGAAGASGTVGLLALGDRSTAGSLLTIKGTKLTAANGLPSIAFPKAIRDPEAEMSIENIGNQASILRLFFLCFDDNGTLYTPTNITAS